jgi:hypothetical protein
VRREVDESTCCAACNPSSPKKCEFTIGMIDRSVNATPEYICHISTT